MQLLHHLKPFFFLVQNKGSVTVSRNSSLSSLLLIVAEARRPIRYSFVELEKEVFDVRLRVCILFRLRRLYPDQKSMDSVCDSLKINVPRLGVEGSHGLLKSKFQFCNLVP